jgi:CheY-like chemotaxis protein
MLRAGTADESLDAIAHASMAAADLTRQLLAFSRQAVLRPKVIDLNEVTANALKLIRRLIGEDIELSFERAPDLWRIEADPTEIERILLNLAANARDAMSKGGTLSIKTMNTVRQEGLLRAGSDEPSGNYVLLTVTDTGDGMDEATRSHIFEPFFTTKDLGKGTGLGLATVFGVVAQSGGKIDVTSTPGEGSRFAMYFPAALRGHLAEDVAARSPRAKGGRETILLVEDERAVRDVVARILKGAGYGVLAASGPVEARSLHASSKVKIALLLTDLVMPGMSGEDLAAALLRVDEGLRVLYLTGYAPRRPLQGPASAQGPFLEKPFTAETLLLRVRAVLEDVEP